MKYTYLKPELKNLSQVERIAFVRQFRGLTQDSVAEKLGLTGENKRRAMTRYEKGMDLGQVFGYLLVDGRTIPVYTIVK